MNSSELLIQLQVVYLSSPVLLMEGDQNTIYAATDSEVNHFHGNDFLMRWGTCGVGGGYSWK